jgi:hypothetical protein
MSLNFSPKTQKIFWLGLAFSGFAMIALNALDYLFGWDKISSAIGITGLVVVATGMKKVKKLRKNNF